MDRERHRFGRVEGFVALVAVVHAYFATSLLTNKANGGPGLYPGITIAAPHRAHAYLRGGQGFWLNVWPEAAIACEARKPLGAPTRCRWCGADDRAEGADVSMRRVRVYDETTGRYLSTMSVAEVCQGCVSAGAEVALRGRFGEIRRTAFSRPLVRGHPIERATTRWHAATGRPWARGRSSPRASGP